MSPFEFVFQYHNLAISDARMGLNAQINITRYINGWQPENNTEYWTVLGKLASKYFNLKSAQTLLSQFPTFSIPNEPRVDPTEEFYVGSLRRAYEGRGSSDEIRDAVRLAFLADRCKQFPPKAYAEKWFGIDCNAFAGNYQGVSPSTAIFAYAKGYPSGAMPGATPDVYVTSGIVKLPPVQSIGDIAQGNLLLTWGKADKRGIRWRHIAVVEDFVGLYNKDGLLSLAEWGNKGQYAEHVVRNKKVTLHDGSLCTNKELVNALRAELPGQKVVCFNGTSPDGEAALRIFFDASKFDNLDHRGWHVGGVHGVL